MERHEWERRSLDHGLATTLLRDALCRLAPSPVPPGAAFSLLPAAVLVSSRSAPPRAMSCLERALVEASDVDCAAVIALIRRRGVGSENTIGDVREFILRPSVW